MLLNHKSGQIAVLTDTKNVYKRKPKKKKAIILYNIYYP